MKDVKKEEFSVEIRKKLDNDSNEFLEQIEVFANLEEANDFVKNHNESLDKDSFLTIYCIEYDENGNEVGYYPVL